VCKWSARRLKEFPGKPGKSGDPNILTLFSSLSGMYNVESRMDDVYTVVTGLVFQCHTLMYKHECIMCMK